MCDSTLHLLTTTVGRLDDVCQLSLLLSDLWFFYKRQIRFINWIIVHPSHCLFQVLWPKLLYYLTPVQYSNATTPLCKSLIVLGTKKKENQDPSFKIDFIQEGRQNVFTSCVQFIQDDPWIGGVDRKMCHKYILNIKFAIWFYLDDPVQTNHISFVLSVNLPSPQTLLVRLFVSKALLTSLNSFFYTLVSLRLVWLNITYCVDTCAW